MLRTQPLMLGWRSHVPAHVVNPLLQERFVLQRKAVEGNGTVLVDPAGGVLTVQRRAINHRRTENGNQSKNNVPGGGFKEFLIKFSIKWA